MPTNLEELYREVIMEHHKSPRNKGLCDDASYQTYHINNPSCGDDMTVQVKVVDGKIVDIKHQGSGCSICCSSASIMSEELKGLEVDKALGLIDDFRKLVMGEKIEDADSLGEAQALQGVSKFPARVKCATLSWKALDFLLRKKDL